MLQIIYNFYLLLFNIFEYRLILIQFLVENELVGSIADWISVIILGIVLPLIFKIWESKQEKEKERILKEEQRKNNELLSLERCGKLYSQPLIKKDSELIFTYLNYCLLPEFVKFNNVMTNVCKINDDDVFTLIITFPFKEKTNITASKILIESLTIHTTTYYDVSHLHRQDTTYQFREDLNTNFKPLLITDEGTILNLYIIYKNDDNIRTNINSCNNIKIYLKAKVINSFNIMTYANWNITAEKVEISDKGDKLNFKVSESSSQIESIIDKNI